MMTRPLQVVLLPTPGRDADNPNTVTLILFDSSGKETYTSSFRFVVVFLSLDGPKPKEQ
ncbi:hypothetical protein AHAS_Ahas03G0219000 [Arachis hypogaea]